MNNLKVTSKDNLEKKIECKQPKGCKYLKRQRAGYPPHCKNENYCEYQFDFGFNKYCGEKLGK